MPTGQEPLHIERQQLLALLRDIIGRGGAGREGEDDPLPPGPWDPVIRRAIERMLQGRSRFGDEVALNPQPLPPREAFLIAVAETVSERADLIQEVARATSREVSEQAAVSGFTSRFSDEWCGNGFRLRWPFPGPRPHWFAQQLNGVDLLVLAAQLDQAGKESFDPGLRDHLSRASNKFAETGLSRVQNISGAVPYIGSASAS